MVSLIVLPSLLLNVYVVIQVALDGSGTMAQVIGHKVNNSTGKSVI